MDISLVNNVTYFIEKDKHNSNARSPYKETYGDANDDNDYDAKNITF